MARNIDVSTQNGELRLMLGGAELLLHTPEHPAIFAGRGKESIKMYRGNFDVNDRVSERFALRLSSADGDTLTFTHPDMQGALTVRITREGGLLRLRGECSDAGINRIWLRLCAEEGEHVTGGGEQFSALDMRGRLFPIWTREQGVGRNKLTEITRLADASDGGGGDYHTTFFPQPTFVSSRLYWAHLENYEYSELDFRAADFHEIGVWAGGFSLVLCAGESYRELSGSLSALLGHQPVLPDWAMKGIWLGVQGGTERTLELLGKCREGGMDVSAVWIQDWEGRRITSFGKRLQWDWRWDKKSYPELDKVIAADENTRWMGYINPYLVEGGVLFKEAQEHGYFVKKQDGSDYLFDFGEYDCGVVDLTMPEAFDWYKGVIKTNLIGLGFRGWMADFGEYLPADCVCFGGSGLEMHNKWPMLWAKCNREAVEETGLLGDCVFFMRAGAAGSQRYSTLLWAGDQCVDWSEDDGLPSVITSALTAGMSGFGLHTCDAGGYTTLFGLHRDEELLLRWLEFTCFSPVMRTHEGNRPDDNIQLYSSREIIERAARLSHIHTALLPYLKACAEENAEQGIPVMRPLFYDAPQCERAYDRELYSYLLGDELLAAPVVAPDVTQRSLWLPEGEWVHLWSGREYHAGDVSVPAPMGEPPVFYKKNGRFAELFRTIAEIS